MSAAEHGLSVGEQFEAYIDWRADNPSDDIMTELLNVEFVDETGTTRRLTREEILVYLNVVAGAGNETTTRLIGWAGKVLAEHPDQRRELVDNPALIPQAIEELLRFEPPAPHMARYVTRDVSLYDQTVPEGSVMLMLLGAAVPRRAPIRPRRRRIQHPSRRPAAPHVQRRRPLLPRLGAGPTRRPRRPGGNPQAVSGVGARPGQRHAQPDIVGAGLGNPADAWCPDDRPGRGQGGLRQRCRPRSGP